MDKPSQTPNRKIEITKLEKWEDGEEEVKINKDTRTLRERMKSVAEKINWLPSFGLDREMDWLTNMHDWLISKKNRYWGLALPIWECSQCGNFGEVFTGLFDCVVHRSQSQQNSPRHS